MKRLLCCFGVHKSFSTFGDELYSLHQYQCRYCGKNTGTNWTLKQIPKALLSKIDMHDKLYRGCPAYEYAKGDLCYYIDSEYKVVQHTTTRYFWVPMMQMNEEQLSLGIDALRNICPGGHLTLVDDGTRGLGLFIYASVIDGTL